MKLDFISQPSSNSTLPFAGLQHMQQCQVNFHLIFAPGFDPNEWCLKNGLLSGGFEPTTFQSSALTTRPRLLARESAYWIGKLTLLINPNMIKNICLVLNIWLNIFSKKQFLKIIIFSNLKTCFGWKLDFV